MRRWLKGLLITIGALLALLVLGLVILDNMDWNRFRGPIARLSKKYVGRELTIAGDLRGHFLTLTPWVEAKDVHFENAEWSDRKDLFIADRVLGEIRLMPLFRSRIDLNRIELDAPDVQLEKTAGGLGNWVFKEPKSGAAKEPVETKQKEPSIPLVRSVRIENAKFAYIDHATGKKTRAALNDLSSHEAERDKPTSVTGHGNLDGLPFSLDAVLGSTQALAAGGKDYPFRVRARLAEASLRTQGTVQDLAELSGLDASFRFNAHRLQDLLQHFGVELSDDMPAVRVTGHLKADKTRFALSKLDGHFGGSRVTGTASARLDGPRPAVAADLTVPLFRWADVKGIVPKKVAKEAPGARKEEAEKTGEPKWIFSPKPLPLAALKKLDADVKVRVEALEGPGALKIVEATSLAVTLKNGRLDIAPFKLAVADGHVTLKATLDTTETPPHLELTTGLNRLDLETLVTPFIPDKLIKPLKDRTNELVQGRLGGNAAVRTSGRSLRDFAANLDGEVGVAMENGMISAPVSELLPIDLTSAVAAFFEIGKDKRVQCLVSHFTIQNGVAKTTPVLIATKDANIAAGGTIDLRQETLDLTVRSFPKQVGLGALKTPVDIKGSLAHPKIDLRKGPLIAKAAAAIGLGALIGPAAALVPLVEPGLGADGACAKYAGEIARIEQKGRNAAH